MAITTQQFRLENVRSLVETFFTGISENQWQQMIQGTPDSSTQIQLAEMILGIIRTVSDTLLTTIEQTNDKPESKKRVLDSLGDLLPRSFSQVLGIPSEAENSSVRSLSEMIRTEITENVDSALSNRMNNTQTALNQRIVPPSSLNVMVSRASEILKKFADMLKRLCCAPCTKEKPKSKVLETYDLTLRIQKEAESPEDSIWTENQEGREEREYQGYSGGTEIFWDNKEAENLVDSEGTASQKSSRELEKRVESETQEKSEEIEHQEDQVESQDCFEETKNWTDSVEAENEKNLRETESLVESEKNEDQEIFRGKEYDDESWEQDVQKNSGSKEDQLLESVETNTQETLEYLSEENFIRKTSESLQEQVKRELKELVLPILDNFSDSEYDKIQSESSLELQKLANEIATSIYYGTEKEKSLNDGRFRIKQYLAKCLSKAWLIRLCQKIKRKHLQQSDPSTDTPTDSLMDLVNFWLQIENQGTEGEDSLISWFNISSNNALIFTKELSDLIYRHLTTSVSPAAVSGKPPLAELDLPEDHNEMYADILGKVWIFVVLMNWWLSSQGQVISERVKLPLRLQLTPPGAAERDAIRLEKNRCCVRFFIEKIVTHVLLDVKMMPDNKHDIINYLFEKVCPKVQGENFYVSRNVFKGLDKRINQLLYKRLGTPEMVLFSINSKDPVVEECIVTIIKERLMKPPKKPSSLQRFFSRNKSTSRP